MILSSIGSLDDEIKKISACGRRIDTRLEGTGI